MAPHTNPGLVAQVFRTGRPGLATGWRLGLLTLAVLWAPGLAHAQRLWDYSPYRIQVWVAGDGSAELPLRVEEQIARRIELRAEIAAGATWELQAVACPPALRNDIACRLATLTAEELQAAAPEKVKEFDKLILVSIRAEPAEFLVQARELDCVTRMWSRTVSRREIQPAQVGETAFAALREAFVPLARIDSAAGPEARVRIRAGGLITDPACVSQIRNADVLRPVYRRDDRQGEPLPNGIQAAPWSFLTIGQRDGTVLKCTLRTGIRLALDSPSAARARKFALVVKPQAETTLLHVVTQGANPQPLAGYEVYARDPDQETQEFVGKTDWRGVVRIPQAGKPLRMLYIKSGGQALARLPMVPGFELEQTAKVINDDPRLMAEGFVKGLQNRVLDLVAMRQLHVVRFRRLLQKKQFDEAKELLDQFLKLESRVELTRLLDQQEKQITSPDRRVQAKIDKLFGEARQMLAAKFLDPYKASELSQELEAARRGAPAKTPPAKPK